MQHGQRTQNAAPNKSPRHRAQARQAGQQDANDLTAATRSAARLAAEAAFALPRISSLPVQPTQVSVRRSRSAGLAVKPTPIPAPTPVGNGGSDFELTVKGARVFRVEAVPTPQPVEATCAGVPLPNETSKHQGNLPDQVHANSRRIASDKRPRPVLHLIHALPELLPERQTEAEAPQPRLGLLIGELQRVTPALEMIARAQAFSLVDERMAREWQRLSRQLDELHAKILTQIR